MAGTHVESNRVNSSGMQIKMQSGSRSLTYSETTKSKALKVRNLLLAFVTLLLSISTLIINSDKEIVSANLRFKTVDDSNPIFQFNQDNQPTNTISAMDPWIIQLNHSYSNTTPIIQNITKFTEKVNNSIRWVSDPFFAFERGYQMVFVIEPKGTNMSVHLHLMKGPYDDELQQSSHWPMRGAFVIELLNQHSDSNHHRKFQIFTDELCIECTSRIVEGTVAKGLGKNNFIPLSMLINNTNYHINDTIYFRISYSTYYSSVVLKVWIGMLPGITVLIFLGCCSIVVILAFTEVYNRLEKIPNLLAGFQAINYHLILRVVFKHTFVTWLILWPLLTPEIWPFLLWEFTNFIRVRTVTIIWSILLEVGEFILPFLAIDIYSYNKKWFVVFKPLFLYMLFIKTGSPITDTIVVLIVILVNMSVVNTLNWFHV